MNKLIIWLLFGFCLIYVSFAVASAEQCPKSILENETSRQALEFLREFEGEFQFGNCFVQLTVCDAKEPSTETTTFVGDLMVTDEAGFQRYVPFYFPNYQGPQTSQLSFVYQRAIHYEFFDYIPDKQHGRYEAYRIEFVKTPDLKQLDRIEIGFVSEKERQRKLGKKWIVCKGIP